MMTDTHETLQSALADLTRRVAAFEKAQATKLYGAVAQEPPTVADHELAEWDTCTPGGKFHRAAAEIRYLRAELARLREGLKWQPEDFDSRIIRGLADNNGIALASSPREVVQCLAREIQRHRRLVQP